MRWIIEDKTWDAPCPDWSDYTEDMENRCPLNCRFRRGEAYLDPDETPDFHCVLFETPLAVFSSEEGEPIDEEVPPGVLHDARRCEACMRAAVRTCGAKAKVTIEVACEREEGHPGEHEHGMGEGVITWGKA